MKRDMNSPEIKSFIENQTNEFAVRIAKMFDIKERIIWLMCQEQFLASFGRLIALLGIPKMRQLIMLLIEMEERVVAFKEELQKKGK